MVRDSSARLPTPRGLIVGDHTHDVIFRDGSVVAESLGGAVSFISAVLDGLCVPFLCVSKVGDDLKYLSAIPPHHTVPVVVPGAKTTLFHAHFGDGGDDHNDRVLKRVFACNPIYASDLPGELRFDIGMAVGVGGEILPETLEKMIEICDVVFVDIQALIREFAPPDGRVKLVKLKDCGFYGLIDKVRFLKASTEEARFMELEEVRRKCCVVVTAGEGGCGTFSEGQEIRALPFEEEEVDPTGAGDSFLGGLVSGIVVGLSEGDSAVLGNFFGSLTVAQVGLPAFDPKVLQGVNDEMELRSSTQSFDTMGHGFNFGKSKDRDEFHSSLTSVKLICKNSIRHINGEKPPDALPGAATNANITTWMEFQRHHSSGCQPNKIDNKFICFIIPA